MDLDDSITLERPRYQRLILPVVAVVIPVIIFVGAAAWFIRAFVAPPMVQISETPPLAASSQAMQLAQAESPSQEPAQTAPPPEPMVTRPPPMMASLAFVPPSLPPPRAVAEPEATAPLEAAAEELVPGEPIAGPIPVPRPRPRIVSTAIRGAVPLPRPRPQSEPAEGGFLSLFR